MDAITFYTQEAKPAWRVTSPYGPRTHPLSGKPSHHNGTDLIPLVSDRRIPIPWPYQIGGEVIATRTMGGRGLTATIRPDGTNELILMQHLDSYLTKPGDRVKHKDPVGVCGTSGDSTGDHLHIEIKKWDGTDNGGAVWGNPVNYQPIKAAPSETFKPGDLVTATANLNIRRDPSIQAPVIGRLDAGKEAQIQGHDQNGIYSNGYNWWFLGWGWAVERWLELKETTVPPAPEPCPDIKQFIAEAEAGLKKAAEALNKIREATK